jgi:molybdate transport system ATP-binding protein
MNFLACRFRLDYPSGFGLDVDFATNGGVTALFGPSGSGKTSVLSVIAGLRKPDAGVIRLGSHVLDDTEKSTHLHPDKRRIGYVFQDQLLFPHLTVEKNLLYGWKRRGAEARPIDFARVVQVLELGELLDRLPHTLSGGQKQRVALGRALLCGPDLLLLDEPLASLDPDLKDRVLVYVEQALKEWRLPTLFVTHFPEEVKRLAHWVIVFDKGRVVRSGAPRETI